MGWWLFRNSLLRQAEGSAERSERSFRACVIELRKIDRALRSLEKRIPPHMHSKLLRDFQTGLIVEERNAEQMLVRTRAMRERIERLEMSAGKSIAQHHQQHKAA